MAASSVFESEIINLFLGYSLEIALFTSDPQDDGTGDEVSGGGYTRLPIYFSTPIAAVGVGTTIKNTNIIVWGPASAPWGTVTHWSIFESGTNNFKAYGTFIASQPVSAGGSITIHPDYLTIVVR